MRRYRIIVRHGNVCAVLFDGMSHREAIRFCEGHEWEIDYSGGLIWDLEIEEERHEE